MGGAPRVDPEAPASRAVAPGGRPWLRGRAAAPSDAGEPQADARRVHVHRARCRTGRGRLPRMGLRRGDRRHVDPLRLRRGVRVAADRGPVPPHAAMVVGDPPPPATWLPHDGRRAVRRVPGRAGVQHEHRADRIHVRQQGGQRVRVRRAVHHGLALRGVLLRRGEARPERVDRPPARPPLVRPRRLPRPEVRLPDGDAADPLHGGGCEGGHAVPAIGHSGHVEPGARVERGVAGDCGTPGLPPGRRGLAPLVLRSLHPRPDRARRDLLLDAQQGGEGLRPQVRLGQHARGGPARVVQGPARRPRHELLRRHLLLRCGVRHPCRCVDPRRSDEPMGSLHLRDES